MRSHQRAVGSRGRGGGAVTTLLLAAALGAVVWALAQTTATPTRTEGERPGLYDETVFRTLSLEFETADWEPTLANLHHTGVEVPATLTVEGQRYHQVGVRFRGTSSFTDVGNGSKRSLNLSLDAVHKEQHLGGYRTLNLLNSHDDPTFLRTVLYFHIAREYLPAPKANFVRLVINGENWGVYVNVQQFNKDFVRDWFDTAMGARWHVPGRPDGRGNLAYLGAGAAPYREIYQIKSKDNAESWAALVLLCQTLEQTPLDKLESALHPMLDVDGALRFLAIENVLENRDGYAPTSSDYDLYRDVSGRFHLVPYDANESFRRVSLSNAHRPAGEPSIELDPLAAATDLGKPLLSRLLSVPALRERYLACVRDIAGQWLDWKKLGPWARSFATLIAEDIRLDNRKLDSTEAFLEGIPAAATGSADHAAPSRPLTLQGFAEQRRDFLLLREVQSGLGGSVAETPLRSRGLRL